MNRDRLEHPDAREDYLDAVRHYRRIDEREGTSLSDAIIDQFEIAIAEVLRDPAGWPRLHYWDGTPPIYKRSVNRFPYLVVFYLAGASRSLSATFSKDGSPATGSTGSKTSGSEFGFLRSS